MPEIQLVLLRQQPHHRRCSSRAFPLLVLALLLQTLLTSRAVADVVCLRNRAYDEYLVSPDGDDFAYDKERRRVFTFPWRQGQQLMEAVWDLQQVGKSEFTLRNFMNGEFLYTSQNTRTFHSMMSGFTSPYHVLTWRSKDRVAASSWRITPIGSRGFFEVYNVDTGTHLTVSDTMYDRKRRIALSVDKKPTTEDTAYHWQILLCC